MKVPKTIPVHFEQVSQLDDRFVKVKIWLMHLGKNYNGSIFTKDAVLRAMDSLKNTPILGYIEESKLGEKDFRGHEVELVVEGGNLKMKYIGQAFGVIPENCNPRFEFKKGDTDEELEYLVVDGLMWTKFDDAINILNTHGEVSQSMELHDDYDGYFDEDGYFVFTRFSFYGACLLGQDVLPAMQKASVEISFSANVSVYQEEIARKLEEYRLAFSQKQKEVEHGMTLDELLSKYSVTVEALAEKGIDVNEFSVEELEEKIKDAFADKDEESQENQEQPSTEMESQSEQESGEFSESSEETTDENEDEEGSGEGEAGQEFQQEDSSEEESDKDVDGKFTLNFELSHEDIRKKMYEQLDTHMEQKGFGGEWYYIVAVFETHLIAENDMSDKFFKIEYTNENDSIVLGEVIEVFPMFLTAEEKGALELMRSSFNKLQSENSELKEFKAKVLKAQHEAQAEELFAQFNKLTPEEVADLREKVHEYSLEELESRLFERLGRKMANFSTPKPSNSLKVKIVHQDETETSGYSHLFKKHGFAK
jgi:hypothetical protein